MRILRSGREWRHALEPEQFVIAQIARILRWPLVAKRASRKAVFAMHADADVAQTRDTGFSWWQWWVMTLMTLLGAFGAFALLTGLPMFLFVRYAQLTQ